MINNKVNIMHEYNLKTAAQVIVKNLDFSKNAKLQALQKYGLRKEDLSDLDRCITVEYQNKYPTSAGISSETIHTSMDETNT